MTIPPAVCAAIRQVRRAAPLASMAVNGSSSTHSAAGRPQAGQRHPGAAGGQSRATSVSNPTSPACASASGKTRAVAEIGKVQDTPTRRQAGFIPGWCLSQQAGMEAVAHAAQGNSPCQYLAAAVRA